MARKHNTRHNRGRSNYPRRLATRGETNTSVRQGFYDAQGKRVGTAAGIKPTEGDNNGQ